MRTLFLAWQAPEKRCWIPVGRLTYDGEKYQFLYINGAIKAQKSCKFQPLQSFPDMNKVYESDSLFPLFGNRVLAQSRPEYKDYVKWLNIPEDEDDPIALLARSGGRRATDSLEIFPTPEPYEYGQYHIHFFVRGLRHLPEISLHKIESFNPGEVLYLLNDFPNPYTPHALLLRTEDYYLVGFCPNYLLEDAFVIIEQCCEYPTIRVERINPPPAPLQYRLLCNMTGCWPDGFKPFNTEMYQPIINDVPSEM